MSATWRRPRALISCSTLDYDSADTSLAQLGRNLMSTATVRITAAGFDPILIDSLRSESSAETALAGIDMLVVMGGDDVHPALYGQDRQPETMTSADDRGDKFEIALVQQAVASGKSVLGICRGMQLMNVALGGSLIQHLDPDGVHAGVAEKFVLVDHTVQLAPRSRLASLFDHTEAVVRSGHHQAVDALGKGLSVTARAADGTIEAIEMQDGNLVFGVQWHPEEDLADKRQLEAILSHFAARR